MILGRILAWLIWLLALMALGAEVVRSLEAGAWHPLALGHIWYTLDPGGINVTQAVVQRYIHPALWDPVVITILRWPTWIVLGVLGTILYLIFRPRPNRRKWFRK